MAQPSKLAFVLASTYHGTLILNLFDRHPQHGFGVSAELLDTGFYERELSFTILQMLGLKRQYRGDGVVAIDGGANIGSHAVLWANHMQGWGEVRAFEPQEWLYYALCGNLCLANAFNAKAYLAALATTHTTIKVPRLDYTRPASFGSLELRRGDGNEEDIGQPVLANDYVEVQQLSIDGFHLPRLDLVKLDVEGMEWEALTGGEETIRREKPVVVVEVSKDPQELVHTTLTQWGYHSVRKGRDLVAIHSDDPVLAHIEREKSA